MDITLKGVDRRVASNGQFYLIVEMEVTDDAGTTLTGTHHLPADALEWRSAEYDIPADDLDTLLDIVLHEPFMDDADLIPELGLHDAPTIEEARTHHLDRITKLKERGVKAKKTESVVTVHDETREKIKGLVVMNPEAVELKRNRVGRVREDRKETRQQMARATEEPEGQRLARLRRELTPQESPRDKEKNNG